VEAIVMAAGEGRRLRPVTERYAKPVLPIDGRPVIVTLVHELRRRNLEYGAVTLCGGGGQGDALLLRVPSPHDP